MKTAAKKAVTTAASKTGEYAGKKAGDKMVQMLSKNSEKKIPRKVTFNTTVKRVPIKKMTSQEINQRVNKILSRGRIRSYLNKMKSFRNPKYLERYEDVVFDLEQPLETNPANNVYQTRTGLRFVTYNTREVTPFDSGRKKLGR